MLEKFDGITPPQESTEIIQEEVQTLGTDCLLFAFRDVQF
jgi:hypothetical protein